MKKPVSTTLMTGASRGLGRTAAEAMLRQSPDVHLVVAVRGGAGVHLAGELAQATGNPNVSALDCDLSSLASIGKATAELDQQLETGQLPPLRGLVANAGLQMSDTTHASVDGYELTFAVNVLANHALIRSLLPRLQSGSRTFITTSDSHFGDFRHNLGLVPAPRWRNVGELAMPGTDVKADSTESGRCAYSTSKLAVIYLVHELARRLGDRSEVYAYNPAFVPGTGLARDANAINRALFKVVLPALALTPLAMTPEAAGKLMAASFGDPRPGQSGSYLDRGVAIRSSSESYDEAREHDLWSAAEQLCGLSN